MLLRDGSNMCTNTNNETEGMGLPPKEEFIRAVYFGDRSYEEKIADPDEFLDMLKEELKDYNDRLIGYSQECKGTFKLKDGKVTDISISGIAFIPIFKDK